MAPVMTPDVLDGFLIEAEKQHLHQFIAGFPAEGETVTCAGSRSSGAQCCTGPEGAPRTLPHAEHEWGV